MLFTSREAKTQFKIPHSSLKFWAHFHEVGHLLGLGHVGWTEVKKGFIVTHRNVWSGEEKAYGITSKEIKDVMGYGAMRHPWHARPWQEAVADFTDTKPEAWIVHMNHIKPRYLKLVPAAHAA